MTTKARFWIAGVTVAAMLGLVYQSGVSGAYEGKDLKATVAKIAEKKGDAGGKAIADAAAKDIADVSDLMHMFRPRNKGGLGWGPKMGKNPAEDGLEKKIQMIAGKGMPPANVKDADENTEAGYWIVAMAELTKAMTPAKDAGGGKTKKAWQGWADDMRDGGIAFAKAAAAKNANDMKTAASKINNACVSCHSKFKD